MDLLREKTLFIVRGLPGAGKTTFAITLSQATGGFMVGPDDYEGYYPDGNVGDPDSYVFSEECRQEAHEWMRDQLNDMMGIGMSPIIVHEVCPNDDYLQPLLDLADEYGYMVVSLVLENRHGNESVHRVPDKAMLEKDADVRKHLKLLPDRLEGYRVEGGRLPKYPLAQMDVGESILIDVEPYSPAPSQIKKMGREGAKVQKAQQSVYGMARRAGKKVRTRRVEKDGEMKLRVTIKEEI